MSDVRKPEVFGSTTQGDERAQLIAALGHDVRAPLQVLGLSLQGLRLRAQEPEDQELVYAAESAFEEVAAITDDLIDSLRFGVAAEPPREEGLTLATLLREVERRFRRRAMEQKVELRVIATRIHFVADRRYLQRILDNLVSNALKHANARKIVVGARLKGYETVILEVMDNGQGISGDELPFIFDEWYRGRGAVTSNTRGQGLGLWIVRRFATAAGGEVTVKSRVGGGTRFRVAIPTYASRRPPPAARLDPTCNALSRKIVAVLDDDDEVLRATRMSLEALGANVFASTDDLHFLAHVTSMTTKPDLLLLDFSLKGHTIERTLKTLRARFGRDLRVVIVSGHTSDPRLTTMEGVEVISKPLTVAHMQKLVDLLNPGANA